jgi:hypothetical protein
MVDLDRSVKGLVEIAWGCARLVTVASPDLVDEDVPPKVAQLGLSWAGETDYDDEAIRPEFDGAPVLQLRGGRSAIFKEGKFYEVEVLVTVQTRLLGPLEEVP